MSSKKQAGKEGRAKHHQHVSDCAMVPPMLNPQMMWPPYNPYAYQSAMGTQPSTSGSFRGLPGVNKKPWEVTSSSSDDDLVPSKKRKVISGPQNSGKRGPGRPSRASTSKVQPLAPTKEARDIVADYPPPFPPGDNITLAYRGIEECAQCRLYVGNVAMVPCGHAKYCFSCVNRLRSEAHKLDRPAKCPFEECFDLVEGWVRLFNVSG